MWVPVREGSDFGHPKIGGCPIFMILVISWIFMILVIFMIFMDFHDFGVSTHPPQNRPKCTPCFDLRIGKFGPILGPKSETLFDPKMANFGVVTQNH